MNQSANESPSPRSSAPRGFLESEVHISPDAIRKGLKYVLDRNPFYILSAVLLLYGFYLISADQGRHRSETAPLIFNFSSLQIYELMAVATAILLARRRVWYDATLLVGLENLLVLVPFILISEAALIGHGILRVLCLVAGVLAMARFLSLKQFFPELNFPRRFLLIGLGILVINVALPVVFRILHESKVGTKPTWGAAYETNQWVWLAVLPLLCGLANLIPLPRESGPRPPQGRWFPMGFFCLWVAATATHSYCLGYVYDFTVSWVMVAPSIWALSWTMFVRAGDAFPEIRPAWKSRLLWLPMVSPFAGLSETSWVFLALTIANAAAFLCVYLRDRTLKLALRLVFVSLALVIGGLPESWVHGLLGGFNRWKCLAAAGACYFILWSSMSRNPGIGLAGGIVLAAGVCFALPMDANQVHWAIQFFAAFVLIHSARWQDAATPYAKAIRYVSAGVWAIQSWVWMDNGGAPWMTCLVAAWVMAYCLLSRGLKGNWGPPVLPIAALLVILSGPGDQGLERLLSASAGIQAIASSFLLFILGTGLATIKSVRLKSSSH
jgi:hypothetical protein